MARIGILGASGYTGAELMRLCHQHPDLKVVWAAAGTQAGGGIADLYPSLAAAYSGVEFVTFEPELADEVDLVFLALPHGEAQRVVPSLWPKRARLVDLSADFRLREPDVYARWYGSPHEAPELVAEFAYGLVELERDRVRGARAVAVPGCYPTAAALALAPLVAAGAICPAPVIVDAASGVSGAGRQPKAATHFGTANEDFTAYGLLDHRHTPEMEQATGAQVLFTPHLAPMTRGILATCYARPAAPTSSAHLLELLRRAYAGERFVVVDERSPSTKATWGSNAAHLTVRYDDRTGWVVVIAAIDNLGKGAAGQALQCANLVLGLDEPAGLSAVGVYP